MEAIRASVAMAVYNGERYIREQVDSVLERMGDNDELVISYDASTDNTKQIIDDYSSRDHRVRVVENHTPGVRNNFNNAVNACKGRYVFLSDQDDLWIGDKINAMVRAFEETGADLMVHDGYMADAELNPLPGTIFERYGTYDNPIHNIIKCNYWGCCMAFRMELWELIGPFPGDNSVCHDHWLGVLAGFYGRIVRINDCFIKHRLHESNVTARKTRKVRTVIKDRIKFVLCLIRRYIERGQKL